MNGATLILMVATCTILVLVDFLYFPKFLKINFFNLILESILSILVLFPLFSIQRYKGSNFYWYLNIGFYLFFVSYFVDAIDQIFIHSIIYTVLLEKTSLIIAVILIFKGSVEWMIKFENLSLTDDLTQIPNRKLIKQLVNKEITQCEKHNTTFCLVIVDIDFFKKTNDEFGHSAGDKFLKSFAHLLLSSINKEDKVGRWGGEEFLIMLKNTDLQRAENAMNKLRALVANHAFFDKQITTTLTGSFGISQWKGSNDDFYNLFVRADNAMYQSKKAGRNLVKTELSL